MAALGADLPGSSLNILEYIEKRKKQSAKYQAKPEVKHHRKRKEHAKMKEERKKDENARFT